MTTSSSCMSNRRLMLVGLLLCTLSVLWPPRDVSAQNENTPASSDRPNVLLIFSCQHSGWAMSCAGAEHLHTPALDNLASDGVRFKNAYTTQPLCMPSRVSMMTGRMPHTLGMTYNGKTDHVSAEHPIGEVMSDAGYDTGWIGKWHLVPEASNGFNTTKKISHDDARVARLSNLFAFKDRGDRPFFLVTSVMRTHDACELARKLGNHGEDETLPDGPLPDPPRTENLPPLPDNFPIPPREPSVLRDHIWPVSPRTYPLTHAGVSTWKRYLWGYHRLVEQMDSHVGTVLEELRQAGKLQNTLVLYVGGHGDGSGAHRWNQKQVLYDESARVPFIVRPPGGTSGRVDNTALVSNLDVLPTIMDYAGLDVPEALPGQSLRPLIEDADREQDRTFVVTETTFGGWNRNYGVHGRMLRTDRFKYIVYNKGKHREQLFDMKNDPGEMVNLANRDQYRDVLRNHRDLLRGWIRKTDDAVDYVPEAD